MARRLINSFNAGEVSPLVDSRVDIEKYGNACRILENCVPKIYGGAFGRAGLEYMGRGKFPARRVRLIDFIFSATTNFVLEFGRFYVRFWSNGVQVEDPNDPGNPLEVASPYDEPDLLNIQTAQINDVVYLVDGAHPPHKLTRKADDDWTLEPVDWKFPALADENSTDTTLEVSATTGAGVTLTASDDVFEPEHVGSFFQIVHRRTGANAVRALTGNGDTEAPNVLGRWDVFTYGTWNADLFVERKNVLGDWEQLRSYTSRSDRNVQDSGEQEEIADLRLRVANYSSHTGNPRAVLELADTRLYGLVKVVAFVSPTEVTVDVVRDVHSTDPTAAWSEAAWSDVQGHPRTVAFHEQRLVFGGCERQPLTLWGSFIGDFENFRRTNLEDASYAHVLGSARGNSIVWIASHKQLIVGSQGDEWVVSSSGEGSVITPTNVEVERQSGYGSAYMQAVLGNDALIFVQRGRKKLREFVYQFEREGYTAPDMTLLAEHIASDGFIQIAFASNPDPVVWAVTEDGQLLSMTFERDQNVVGWSRHPTDGTVESVAVVFGQAGLADEVWVSVRRMQLVNGEEEYHRHIERLDPAKWQKLEDEDMTRFIYSDSAKVIELSPAATEVPGLEHLEGREVAILADGYVHPRRTVLDGKVELDQPAGRVVAGLPFVPQIQPTRTEVPLEDGTAQGRKFRVHRVTLKVWRTQGGESADAPGERFFVIPMREAQSPMSEQQPPASGFYDLPMASNWREGVDVVLRQPNPLPFHVLAIIPSFEIAGP